MTETLSHYKNICAALRELEKLKLRLTLISNALETEISNFTDADSQPDTVLGGTTQRSIIGGCGTIPDRGTTRPFSHIFNETENDGATLDCAKIGTEHNNFVDETAQLSIEFPSATERKDPPS